MVITISKPQWIRSTLLMVLLPAVVLSGYYVSRIGSIAWLILPVLHVFAVGLPVFWFLHLGVRNLPTGSPQRRWGVFGSGMALGPALIMTAEIFAGLFFLIVFILYISSQPELSKEIIELSDWVMKTNPQPDQILEKISNYLLQPAVLFAIFLFGGFIVPLIEEAIKPIGVWLLAGRNLAPVEGFTAGILSGAGYAFFESLALTSAGEEWAVVVVARIGTAVIHILTAGLMGWALVNAWQLGRYVRLGLTYLGVVVLHGLWNCFTLFAAVVALPEELGLEAEIPSLLSTLGKLAPFILGLATAGAFVGLIAFNNYLARQKKSRADQLERNTASAL